MTQPEPLEPSDSPEATLAGDLGTVTDDELDAARAVMPPLVDEHDRPVDVEDPR